MDKTRLQHLAGVLTEKEVKPRMITIEIASNYNSDEVADSFIDFINEVSKSADSGASTTLIAENGNGEVAKWGIDGDGGDRIKVAQE